MRTKTKISILSALMVLSMFAMAVMPASASPGATTATEGTATDPGPTASAAVTTEGGNITEVNLEADTYTERWAGFYGNVTGNISLGSESADLYQWEWTPASEGEVIASTDGSGITWASLENGSATEVDIAWSFTSSGSDNATAAFTDSDTFTIGDTTMTSAPAVATLGTSYKTGIVKDNTTVIDTDDLLFVVNIINDGTTFNSGTHDFEMMVPTGTTETYYFYVELS